MSTALKIEEPTLFDRDKECEKIGVVVETNEEYQKSPGLSFSGLKHFRKTPAHYKVFIEDQSEDETKSQRLGTLAHMAILEPERFANVLPIEGHRGKKETKDMIAKAKALGKYVCTPDEYKDAARISKNLKDSKTASALLTGGVAEESIYWRDPVTGILLKCRPDYRRLGVLVDLKTFDDLSDDGIDRQILRMRYHWQSAFYLKVANGHFGSDSNMFAHLFLDTKAFLPRVKVLDDAALEKANAEINELIVSYAECLRTDVWPGYPDEITPATLPHYGW